MKRSDMDRKLPFEADYSLLDKCRNAETIGLYIVSVLSVVIPLFSIFRSLSNWSWLMATINIINMIAIVSYYVLNVVTETFLYPATARKRRRGFLDNSLGTKYLDSEIMGYFTNESISVGPRKMLVNCWENCFFTFNIAKAMLRSVIIKNSIFAIGFFVIAYWGFRDSLVAIPILQVLLSSLFITDLIHHINFIAKLKYLLEQFAHEAIKTNKTIQTWQSAILLLLDYETTLAYNKAPLSNKIYERLNESLSMEWEGLKKRYEIS